MTRVLALLAALLLAPPALAAESAAITTAHATVTLVSAADSVEPGKPVRLGLRFRMAPGWHIYWSNPGDAGQAPEFKPTLASGVTAGEFDWPVPSRVLDGPVMTYAYSGEVMLPFTVSGASGPLKVDGSASWLICQKVCVPEEGNLTLDLPVGSGTPSAEAGLFAAADAQLPRPSPFAASVAPDGTLSLTGEGLSPATVKDAWFFPATWGAIVNAAPQNVTVGDGRLTLALQPGDAFHPGDGLAGVVVLRDPSGQETGLAMAAKPGPPVAAGSAAGGLAETLLFAFLGGLILNLMPCVFPVLAMKALALVRLSGVEQRAVRAHAVWYAAGVLSAFAALAVVLLAVRAAGGVAAWGFQFQSPVFVAATAWVLFAVGLSLSGVFTVGNTMTGLGQELTARGGHAGSFFTGLLAVVVATPCTAPFMGAAVAAALAASAPVAIATFLVMGLGLAAPYTLLALVPGLARFLPRPGRWMEVLKQGLAFPMYAAAAWLVWVMTQLGGSDGVQATVAGLVLVGFAAWAYGASQGVEGRGRWLGLAAAAAALVASAAILPGLTAAAPDAKAETVAGEEPFSSARLAALRADGRPVFVDMTAAWCVTCLVNERVALSPTAVRDAFARNHVAYLRGDWTRQDPDITRYLRDNGRDGVPLYVYYPPHDGRPTVLPQILTENTLIGALKGG
ncbi:MAG TPA: protein-disulfide reductase DsbD domain-containing protein [Stellaceae bacterium]|nr:protein-disulfide reductase DsbD domain-containing protein [Stellaceae bacterium]